jgi:8-oxo-dGTP pyrophosphatase MutT (NUDIX family)
MNRDQFFARFQRCVTADRQWVSPLGTADLNPGQEVPSRLKPAAVLVPVVDRGVELTVLLTRRTDHLTDHAGQISFPGGRIEAEDATPEDAALREAAEEIGLAPERVRLLGRLESHVTRTGFKIVPVVGLVEPPFELVLDPFEVADAFEVPLAFLLDPANHQRHQRDVGGRTRHFHAMTHGDHYIWGATAGMLMNLYERLVER